MWVLRKRSEKYKNGLPVQELTQRAIQVHKEKIQLPAIDPPKRLKPRGSHVVKPTKEELLDEKQDHN